MSHDYVDLSSGDYYYNVKEDSEPAYSSPSIHAMSFTTDDLRMQLIFVLHASSRVRCEISKVEHAVAPLFIIISPEHSRIYILYLAVIISVMVQH